VSAAKLRRSQDRILSARPYAKKMLEVLSSLAARVDPDRHPLLARRPEEQVLLVVMTADKGLCGSFNTNILNQAKSVLDGMRDRKASVDPVGRKARDWFRRRRYPTRRVLVDIFGNLTPDHARDIASNLIDAFLRREFDAIHLVYNEFKSVMQQRVVTEPLLPIPRGAFAAEDATREDYLYEPSAGDLLDSILPKHVEVQVFRALLESAAAEHGARMTAMENATRNAGEMIDSLTLQMNKIRQAYITKEILEVVSGAEALK